MLVRDVRTGRLITVPDNRFSGSAFGGHTAETHAYRGGHTAGQGLGHAAVAAVPHPVGHDGLGSPLGLPFLAALAPMAGAVLPSLLPMIPSLGGGLASLLKSIGGPMSVASPGVAGYGYYPGASMNGVSAVPGPGCAVPGLGYYGAAPPQVIYDGLGNPLGLPFLAALAPMLSSLLPSLASGASKILPGLISAVAPSVGSGTPPAPAQPQATPAPDTSNVSPMPAQPAPSGPPPGVVIPDAHAPAMRVPLQPPDEIVAPMRVQGPNGQSMVVPVRLRRRGRRRRRLMRRVQPMVVARPPPSTIGYAPGFGFPAHPQGWPGFNGWRGG
jgi:hypothetical protein